MEVDAEEAGSRRLALVADKARPILRGEKAVILREDRAACRATARRGRRTGWRGRGAAGAGAADEAGFEALRAWRAAEAKAQGVPPYVIFHDSVLRDIAAVRPGQPGRTGADQGRGGE